MAVECTAIRWGDPVDGAAQRLVDEAEGRKEGAGAIAEAVGFLAVSWRADRAARRGWRKRKRSRRTASRKATLRRAREKIGVMVQKEGGVEHGRWMWSLPRA